MNLGFRGEVTDFYHRYRRGYPPEAIDSVVAAFALTARDLVLDLGCGTGQLTVPLAGRVGAVLGVDPEPDMLARARSAAADRPNISWLLGADTDLPALRAMLGERRLGAVVIGQALHWMDHDRLFRTIAPMLRPGGGIAVLSNGLPLWLQDTDWSRALHGVLAAWSGRPATATCGTDLATQRRYAESLAAAGFTVATDTVEYTDTLDLDRIVGGVLSALPANRLPAPDQQRELAARISTALAPYGPFTERVPVTILTGVARRRPSSTRREEPRRGDLPCRR